jgi:hypothetical protein
MPLQKTHILELALRDIGKKPLAQAVEIGRGELSRANLDGKRRRRFNNSETGNKVTDIRLLEEL